MRRNTTRSSRSTSGARRASSSRSRPHRSKRTGRPHLTQRQVREVTGVLFVLAALLGLLALASNAGSILNGLRESLLAAFDHAWFVPVGAALALPYADAAMMQLHLDEISRNVAAGAHAVLLLDRAGWHTTSKLDVPDNITPIFLPSRAPELNPVENVWQYLRQNWLSNTVFENYDAIVDAACAAWRKLITQPETITSIGMRDWAHVGQPL